VKRCIGEDGVEAADEAQGLAAHHARIEAAGAGRSDLLGARIDADHLGTCGH
jgi:hypothetical protein